MSGDLLSDFEKFEKDNNLFDITINQIPIWERIRNKVWNRINFEENQNKPQNHSKNVNKFKSLYLLMKNIVYKNPYLSDEYGILIYGTSRRQMESNIHWWDIYFDPLYESGLDDYLHLEPPKRVSHYNPIQTDNYRYVDLIEYGSQIQMKLGLNESSIPNEIIKEINIINQKLNDEFDKAVDLLQFAYHDLHLRRTKLWLYERLIRAVNPKILVIECSYGKETLIEVAKTFEIPVIELQHSMITERHLGYHYEDSTKIMFPDYLFVWGDFWKETANIPLPDDRIISTGYPYLDKKKNDLKHIDDKKQVIFISQKSIGEELSKLAVSLERNPEFDYDIIYKLHPKEYDDWEAKYPALLKEDMKVIGSDGPGLYNLFKESQVQVGVYSTALFEGLEFGLETYIYKISGWKYVKNLIKKGPAQLISSAEQMLYLIGELKKEDEKAEFFKDNGLKNTIEEIKRIKKEGTTFSTN